MLHASRSLLHCQISPQPIFLSTTNSCLYSSLPPTLSPAYIPLSTNSCHFNSWPCCGHLTRCSSLSSCLHFGDAWQWQLPSAHLLLSCWMAWTDVNLNPPLSSNFCAAPTISLCLGMEINSSVASSAFRFFWWVYLWSPDPETSSVSSQSWLCLPWRLQ